VQQNFKTKTKAKAGELDYHIGQTVRSLRMLKGFSQQELAHRIDLTFQQIQKYENGKNKVSASRLYEIMAEFDIHPNEFFDLLDERTNKVRDSSLLFDPQSIEMIALFKEIQSTKQKEALIKFVKEWIKTQN